MKKTILISFLVFVSFMLIAPVGIFAGEHSVISERPLYLVDGDTGQKYSQFEGYSLISWQDMARYGFFYAKAVIATPIYSTYEFTLTAISSTDKKYIEGLWDIKKNGAIVCEGCVGKAYGLDTPVGGYFKLYIGDSQCNDNSWHFSGYITDRFDF